MATVTKDVIVERSFSELRSRLGEKILGIYLFGSAAKRLWRTPKISNL